MEIHLANLLSPSLAKKMKKEQWVWFSVNWEYIKQEQPMEIHQMEKEHWERADLFNINNYYYRTMNVLVDAFYGIESILMTSCTGI